MNAKACAHAFATYLYNNNHLNSVDFSIDKSNAKVLFKSFCKEYRVKHPFCTIFYPYTINLLKKQKNRDVMVYKENKILELFKNQQTGVKNVNNQNQDRQASVEKNKMAKSKATSVKQKNSIPEKQTKSPDLQVIIDDSPILDNIILRPNTSKTLRFTLKNNTNLEIPISAVHTKQEVDEIQFKNVVLPYNLKSGSSITWQLLVRATTKGVFQVPIFITAKEPQEFVFDLVFHTHHDMFDDLHPSGKYQRTRKPSFREYVETINSGERPNIFPKKKMAVQLKQYFLPTEITFVLNTGMKEFEGITPPEVKQLKYMKDLLNVEDKARCLNASNYTKLLDLFLYIEEHQMHKDIRDYDQEDQVLTKVGRLLELQVPGLAEHRPSVIISDSVFIKESKDSRQQFQGFVHQVKESSVLLHFSETFMDRVFVKGKKFYVQFSFNRYPLRVEHQAVEFTKVDNIASLLFPKKIRTSPVQSEELVWFNSNIADNSQQQQAVLAILNKTSLPAPYLIFGPPGTGKTMTVVESVKQIHKRGKEKILICAPSNSAANEVTKHLINTIPTTDLLRFVAPSYSYNQIPHSILKHVNYKHGEYYQPTIDEFAKFKVVVITLASAAKLVNSGCPPNHFGYLFVDESGQATETENLIPIARILSSALKPGHISGQIVLAGDPRQLGPILHSSLAKEYGFGISMLERLMDRCEPYAKDASKQYNPNALTKLLKNYRSHPVIINRSNYHFYDEELECAGDHLIHAALNWEHLPNPKFPLMFHSVVGVDQREKNSPSFFNIQEVQVVADYLDKLIGCKLQGIKIEGKHIGIVSPYKKQVDKIRSICRKKKYSDDLLVGTVEQVQGQERLIIIVSTVRSKAEMLKFDRKFHLGFLDNPKRFNVAVTRAKALLIVIGNPNLLQFDKYWRSLILYCTYNNSFVGDQFVVKEIEGTFTQNALTVDAQQDDGPSFRHSNI